MKVHVTLTDSDACVALSCIAAEQGMTVSEWVDEAFRSIRRDLTSMAKDVRDTGLSVKLEPRLSGE
jgi:hypothetical protein